MDCLEKTGRRSATEYPRATLCSTLSPCDMCSGAALLYKIARIVIGENQNFQGPETLLRQRGVELTILNDAQCIELMRSFICDQAQHWFEDIGQ